MVADVHRPVGPEPSDAPWAMQLVARVEKANPAPAAHLAEAAVLAVIDLLTDERSGPDGRWAPAIDAWQEGGRIRKLVRRARGSDWSRAQLAEGRTASVSAGPGATPEPLLAEVRAFVPSPMDRVPEAVAKLQIRSTALDRPPSVAAGEDLDALLTDTPTLLLVVSPDVEMSWGKWCAQCAHGGQLLWRQSSIEQRVAWEVAGRPVLVVHPESGLWSTLLGRSEVEVFDAGFTEIPAGTRTVVALWS